MQHEVVHKERIHADTVADYHQEGGLVELIRNRACIHTEEVNDAEESKLKPSILIVLKQVRSRATEEPYNCEKSAIAEMEKHDEREVQVLQFSRAASSK
jgi:hypothetical protein